MTSIEARGAALLSPAGESSINNSEASQTNPVTEKVLANPLILKTILKNLEKPDLLQTSLVNKGWNLFSREVLRESKCAAIIDPRNSCYDLKRFCEALKLCTQVPFAGLSIMPAYNPAYVHECVDEMPLCDLASQVLKEIDVKNLSVEIDDESDCVIQEFIHQLLEKCANSLQEFYLSSNLRSEELSTRFGADWLPNLRHLDLHYSLYDDDCHTPLLKDLIEAAPRLQTVNGRVHAHFLEFLLPRELGQAIQTFFYRPTVKTLKLTMEFALQGPKLKVLVFGYDVQDDDHEDFEIEEEDDELLTEHCQGRIARVLNTLLASSKNSLEKFATNFVHLMKIINEYDIPVLQNVSHLNFTYGQDTESEGYPSMEKLDWFKYFPKLNEVCVTIHDDCYNYASETFRENSETRFVCETVTTFRFVSYHKEADGWEIPRLQVVFPNVKHFYFESANYLGFYSLVFGNIMEGWPHLEDIYGYGILPETCTYFDSILLGINMEELEKLYELRYSDFELENLEIVPVRPCITNFRNLKKIAFGFSPCYRRRCEITETLDFVFMSRLVGSLLLSRWSGLSFEIYRTPCDQCCEVCAVSCYLGLHHLQPFVKFGEFTDPGMPF